MNHTLIFTFDSERCTSYGSNMRMVRTKFRMLPSMYKYFAIALLFFTSSSSSSSTDDYFSKLKTAVSVNDVNTVNQLLLQTSVNWLTEERGWEIARIAAEKGNLLVILYIAEHKLSILEKKNEENETIGHIAAEHGHPKITEYFLDKARREFWSPSGREKKSLFDLIAKKGYLDCISGRLGYSDDFKHIARIAAQNGHLDIACYVAIEKNEVYCKDFEDIIGTAIKNSRQRDPKTLELFAKLTDKWGSQSYCPNVVALASSANNSELIEYLAENNCTHFLKCDNRYVCKRMEIAFERNLVDKNFLDCLERETGTILGYIGESKLTIGHIAAQNDHLDVIRFLAEKNASILERVDADGETVVDVAAKKGYADIVRYAVRQKPLAGVKKTWTMGTEGKYIWDIWSRARHYSTAFHLAVAKNWMDTDTLSYVIEKEGTDLITKADEDRDGETVAHIAATNANMEILQYLVQTNPSVFSKSDSIGDTPLHILAKKGNLEILRLVVERETSVFEGNASIGIKMAEIAARRGYSNILKFIMDKKPILLANRLDILFKLRSASQVLNMLKYLKTACYPNITNWDRRHVESKILRLAFKYDYPEIIRFMEYDVNMVNDRGEPLIFIATRRNRSKVFYYLADHRKTNLTALDRDGNNILSVAAKNRDLKKMQYILDTLKAPIDIEWRNNEGNSLLHVAVHEALSPVYTAQDLCEKSVAHQSTLTDMGMIKYLVEEKHARTDARGHENMTPLQCAARHGNYFISNYLLDHGAHPKLRNANGSNFWQVMHFPTVETVPAGTVPRGYYESHDEWHY